MESVLMVQMMMNVIHFAKFAVEEPVSSVMMDIASMHMDIVPI